MKAPMIPVAKWTRAYCAPVVRGAETPTWFDPSQPFDLQAPPAPWVALGDVANLKRTGATKVTPIVAGPKGAVAAQFRATLEAKVACDFVRWGKLQMALAGGSQHMNVLATVAGSSGMGNPAVPPVAVLANSSASELVLGAGAVSAFNVGDMVACDVDYQQETGYIGSPAAAYVSDPAMVNRDPNYLRRVTFNVARVAQVTATAVELAEPLIGGAPATGAQVQKVIAFADREGGSYFQEWSLLFALEPESGGQVCFYYPRVQACSAESETAIQCDTYHATALHADLMALPVTDPVDGEQVVCYRTYVPATTADVY
jgi:hypothetical protein